MKQHLVELERIHFARVFPWVHLFKSFRIALDLRKMLLGAAGLLLLAAGLWAFSYLPLELSETEAESLRQAPWNFEPPFENTAWLSEHLDHVSRLLAQVPASLWQPAWRLVEEPLTWSGAAIRWTQILWALCVWSFFGLAISRIAAVQFAVDERVSLKEAARFAGAKWLWSVSAPLMPLAGVLILWLGCVVFGWIGRIPGAGPILFAVLWIIPFLLAFGVLLLLIGLAFGWPLMIATIATQGSDAFDGFSRSFDYVYSRFWHLVWFVIVAILHGLLTVAIVAGAVRIIFELASTFLETGMGAAMWEPLPSFARFCLAGWQNLILLLLAGYGVSYFWSASTIIYFLLRQSEDANHLSEVYLRKEDSSDEIAQLAGVAASEQPIIERPPKHEPASQPSSETE